MELNYEEDVVEPASPPGHYLSSSVLSISNLVVLEFEVPIDGIVAQTMSLVKHVFLSISPRFSSILVEENGKKHWKKVGVKMEEHVKIPTLPSNLSLESYDNYFDNYISKLAVKRFSLNKPLWEIHFLKFPTSNAAGTMVFNLHHALGDGYSLMGALLSCLKRAEDPSLPLTFPSRRRSSEPNESFVSKVLSSVFCTISDLINIRMHEDDVTPIRSGNDGIESQPITVSTMTFSLDQIKMIKNRLGAGVTVNDVLTGTIFLGARLYMQAMKESSCKAQGSAVVALSTRMNVEYTPIQEMIKPKSKDSSWGNRFTLLHMPIPELAEDFSDALDFVWKVQKLIRTKRTSLATYLTAASMEILNKLGGPEVVARHMHRTLKNSSMVISNLIGPVEQMSLANHPVKGLYFLIVGTPQGLDATIVSYMGKVRVAFKMEKGFIDQQKFKACMEAAYDMILDASAKDPIQVI